VIEQKDLTKWESKAVEEIAKRDDIPPPTASQLTLAGDGDDAPDRAKVPEELAAEEPEPPARLESPMPRAPPKKLKPWGVLLALVRSPRGVSAFLMTFIFGLVLGTLDPTYASKRSIEASLTHLHRLTLRVQAVWHKNSAFVGLIYRECSLSTVMSYPDESQSSPQHLLSSLVP